MGKLVGEIKSGYKEDEKLKEVASFLGMATDGKSEDEPRREIIERLEKKEGRAARG